METIGGCDHAGISFLKGGKGSTPAASDGVPPLVDAIQYETGEGPCLSAIREHEVFQTGDLRPRDQMAALRRPRRSARPASPA